MRFDPVGEDAPHLGVDLHLRVDVIAGATLAEKDMGRRPRRRWPPERCSDSKEVAWGGAYGDRLGGIDAARSSRGRREG
jgi:hypothetical protein